jgi:hypothetical protein
VSPLFLLGRALEFPNGELFIEWKKWKMVKKINEYSLRGEWNGLLKWCLKAPKKKEDSQGIILAA